VLCLGRRILKIPIPSSILEDSPVSGRPRARGDNGTRTETPPAFLRERALTEDPRRSLPATKDREK
jgi:hypothetical protein